MKVKNYKGDLLRMAPNSFGIIGEESQLPKALRTEAANRKLNAWKGTSKLDEKGYLAMSKLSYTCSVILISKRVLNDKDGKALADALTSWLSAYPKVPEIYLSRAGVSPYKDVVDRVIYRLKKLEGYSDTQLIVFP